MSNISGRNAVNRFCTSAILLYLSLSVINTKINAIRDTADTDRGCMISSDMTQGADYLSLAPSSVNPEQSTSKASIPVLATKTRSRLEGTDAGPTGPNALYTLAGNRITGNSGDGGPPASAQLQYLTGVATDEVTSDFYIADTFNNRIRVVKSTTGIVSTVAGTGIAGFGGDGGHATLAQLYAPNSVAMDSTARLIYISDSLNYRIRMVNMSTGIITTVAGTGTFGYNGDGGLAMYASVSNIEQCAVEFSTGNLFMADSGDDRVRMITLSTGIITTVAGNGKTKYSGDGGLATSASLGNPTGIALDSSGNLYIADTDHFVIRMVLKSTGIITTIAGLAPSQGATSHYQSGGYGGDGGLAIATLLNYPTALAMDSNQGLLYIADTSNNVIRVVSMVSGIITTAAGSSMAGHSEDSGRAALVTLMGVAVDITTGTLYIPDVSNVVREVIQNVGTMSPSTPPANTSQTSEAPSPSSMTQTPSPSSMTHTPSPSSMSQAPSPSSMTQAPSPSSMTQAPSPSSMTQAPSPSSMSQAPSPSSMTQTPSPSSMTQTPSPSSMTQAPSPSSMTQTPSPSSMTQAPSPSSMSQAPSPSSMTQTPSPSSMTQAPSPSSMTQAPSPSSMTQAPSPSSMTQAPSPSSMTQAPSPSSMTQTPSPSSMTQTPSPSSMTQAPSPRRRSRSPSPSSMTQTPSPGRRSRSPGPSSKSQTPSPSSMSQAPSPSSMTQTPSRRRRSRSPSLSSMTQAPSQSSMTQAPSQRRKSRYPSPSPSRVPIAYFSPSLPPDVYFYSPSAPPDVYFYSPSAPPDVYFYSPSAPPDVYFYSPSAPPDVYFYSPSAPPDVYFYSPSAPPDVYFYSPSAPPDVYYYSPSSLMNPSGPVMIIDTVVGTGRGGYNGDEIPAINAEVHLPSGLATLGTTGNIYVCDTLNQRVRMVNYSGTIRTVAGTGVVGYSGDGNLATEAMLNEPNGVAVDVSSGDVYIADTLNHRIRMVKRSTGIITTVAGTGQYGYTGGGQLATSAPLNRPYGVCLDSQGNIYISDTWNFRLRMVSKMTGIITTIAGTGKAGFSGDGGKASEAAITRILKSTVDFTTGYIYMADADNHRIRMVNPSNRTITTVAGTGLAGFSGDGLPATAAQLFLPSAVTTDADGNLYIADTSNNRIRVVTRSSGIITTFAGSGVPGFSGDGNDSTLCQMLQPLGLVVDSFGGLLVADTYNNRIRRLSRQAIIMKMHQIIQNLDDWQARTDLFRVALSNTVASIMGVAIDAVTLSDYAAMQNWGMGPHTVDIRYTAHVYTMSSAARLESLINQSFSDGTFSQLLSQMSGIPDLIVQQGFDAVPRTRNRISQRAVNRLNTATAVGASLAAFFCIFFGLIFYRCYKNRDKDTITIGSTPSPFVQAAVAVMVENENSCKV